MLTVQTPVTPAAHAVETTPALPVAQAQAQAVLATLPGMADEVVIATARLASQWMLWAYIIRGACAAELLSRQPRLVGGRGKKDVDGQGRQAQMAQLAIAFGIEPRTLADDIRIYERFFAPGANGSGQSENGMEANLARYIGLGRDHFRVALAAPDPVKFIEGAIEGGQDGVCSVRRLRAIVQASKTQRDKVTVQSASGLVFDVEQCVVSDLLGALDAAASAVNTSLRSATPAGAIPWEEMLGEETVASLHKLVARHNAACPTNTLDTASFIRRLVRQAVRDVDDNLAAEAEMSTAPVFELTPA